MVAAHIGSLIFLLSVACIMILSTIWIFYQFIRRYGKAKQDKKLHKKLLCPTFGLFTLSPLALIALFTQIMFEGHPLFWLASMITNIFWLSQMYFLSLTIFIRICVIFNETVYNLAKITMFIYKSIFIFCLILLIGTLPAIFLGELLFIVLAIIFLFEVTLNLSLLAIFIYKLIEVNKHNECNDADQQLLNVITKNTVLTIWSNTTTFLVTIFFVLIMMTGFKYEIINVIGFFCNLLDCYTNFISIVLTFSYFESSYATICGCLDKKLKVFCKSKMMNIKLAEITTRTSPTSNSINSSDIKLETDAPNKPNESSQI